MFDTIESDAVTSDPAPGYESYVPELAPEDLVDELESLFRLRDRLEARISLVVGRVLESRAYEHDGYSSVTALLKDRVLLHPGEAMRFVSRGSGLREAKHTAAAYVRGYLSGAQVDVLLEGWGVAPDNYRSDEQALVDSAVGVPTVELRKRLDHWVEQTDSFIENYLQASARESQSLAIRRERGGMRLTGWFDIEAGERLRAELDPGPPAAEDERSAGARRADALLDIVNGAAKRPSLIVHVSAERLAGTAEGISETANGTFLSLDEMRRLACDSTLTRVIFGAESRPLDVGRKKRLVPEWLRDAVSARDLRCVFPGCDRPSNWCNVHHLKHWADDGETEIDNLVLLCRHHHTLVHEVGWKITGRPRSLRFWRPSGEELGKPSPRRATTPFVSVEWRAKTGEWVTTPLSVSAAVRAIRGP